MKRLIVNADDFGLTQGVNRAILEGHQAGIITNASLLANGAAFDSAAETSIRMGTLGVGVHLNLTDGRPSCGPVQVRSLLSSGDVFPGSPGVLAWRVLRGESRLEEVEAEWRGQIEKIVSAGVRISHLDSHKHVHLLPPLFGVVVKLAREFHISCVRCPVEPLAPGPEFFPRGGGGGLGRAKQYLLARALSTLAAWQKKKLKAAGLGWPERFYGLSQTGFLDTRSLGQIFRGLPEGTSELICHPGYADAALLATRTRLRSQRETELAALTEPGIKELVAELGIELISYGELAGKRFGGAKSSMGKDTPSVQEIVRKA